MSTYYQKKKNYDIKKIIRILSFLIAFIGFIVATFIFFPLLSWQIFFSPIVSSYDIKAPIPKTVIVNSSDIKSLLSQASNTLTGVDYTNARNWFPTFNPKTRRTDVGSYTISIPKLEIRDAAVSTFDNDLSLHLVNYQGTAIPPEMGNAVVFGHSTLPQLFNSKDYKTIFANVYKLKIGDEVLVNISKVSYKYKVYNINVVDPEDTSELSQNYNDRYLTLVTCTPPGTVWKRLIIKARLEKI